MAFILLSCSGGVYIGYTRFDKVRGLRVVFYTFKSLFYRKPRCVYCYEDANFAFEMAIGTAIKVGGNVIRTNDTPQDVFSSKEDAFHLDVSLLVPDLQSKDRMGAIKELVDRLYGSRKVTDSLKFLQTVLDREDQVSTVLGRGVALPHARCRSVVQPSVALGISHEGIVFPSDTEFEPVHVICMVAVPDAAPVPYLSVLSDLAMLFKDSDVRAGLMGCETSTRMCQFLTEHLCEVRKLSNANSV